MSISGQKANWPVMACCLVAAGSPAAFRLVELVAGRPGGEAWSWTQVAVSAVAVLTGGYLLIRDRASRN